jgi:hypothetical protein
VRFWRSALVIFALVNVGGGIYAAVTGEMMHAGVHFALLAVTFGLWEATIPKPRQLDVSTATTIDPQLEHLQQSLDSIALEVERIGEAQRYITKLGQERVEAPLIDKPDNSPNE